MIEEWRSVVGYDGLYSVSNLGGVRSEPRIARHHTGRPSRRHGKLLKQIDDGRGYLQVGLSRDGKASIRKVAHLVAESFIGTRPERMQVCHTDGCPKNNAASNLRYDTPKANHADKWRHGTMLSGERSSFAKLTEADVAAIRGADGTQAAIARKFGVTQPAVSMIKSGARWSNAAR